MEAPYVEPEFHQSRGAKHNSQLGDKHTTNNLKGLAAASIRNNVGMLVRSALRSISASSSEHNAYIASLLTADEAAPETLGKNGDVAAPPAVTAPPTGNDSVSPVQRLSPRKKTNIFSGSPPRQHDLEVVQSLEAEVAALVLQIVRIERDVEEVQEAIANGSEYRGRQREALEKVEEGLLRKELLLREKEKQLRDEKMMLLRLHTSNSSHQPKMASATTSANGEGEQLNLQ